ncbi:MAG: YkgJ family cysteine cluster protein [Desulfurococcaceae archaeon]
MPFEDPRCLRCARCCFNTEMPLSRSDIERISGALGLSPEQFAERRGRIYVLRNVEGHCVFLNPSTRECSIYPIRPKGCRAYPLVLVPGRGFSIDPLCPLRRDFERRAKDLEEARALLESLLDELERDYGSAVP